MGETTEISWADATFNPWIGCTRVSPGCANCYAEQLMDVRYHRVKWGKGQPRQRTSEANWRQPLAWNRKAEKSGVRQRVFCASLADWLDPEVDPAWLADLLALVAATPALDWMLLTKRPQLWRERLEAVYEHDTAGGLAGPAEFLDWLEGKAPPNVWVGATVEDQQRADERIPALLKIPARVRFLSCEPLLGPVDLSEWIGRIDHCASCGSENPPQKADVCPRPQCESEGNLISTWGESQHEAYRTGERYAEGSGAEDGPEVHWIIAGGESGHRARPMHPAWVRSLRDQATEAGVAFHFKQWGEWRPGFDPQGEEGKWCSYINPDGSRGEAAVSTMDEETWTNWTGEPKEGLYYIQRVGKGAAGRELDGRTWDELPEVARG